MSAASRAEREESQESVEDPSDFALLPSFLSCLAGVIHRRLSLRTGNYKVAHTSNRNCRENRTMTKREVEQEERVNWCVVFQERAELY